MKELTLEEANSVLDSGGIISCWGYTYIGREHYLAYGTFPGNVRGGNINLSGHDGLPWQRLTIRELIEKTGFYPCPWLLPFAMKVQRNTDDYSVNFENMIKYSINSDCTVNQLKDPIISSIIWRDYFKDLKDKDK